jgi:hypothetical protein
MQNVLEYHGQLNAELTSANNRVDILQKKINDLNGDRLSLEKETLTLGTNSLALERESDVLQSAVDDYPPESDALPSLLSVNVRLKKVRKRSCVTFINRISAFAAQTKLALNVSRSPLPVL